MGEYPNRLRPSTSGLTAGYEPMLSDGAEVVPIYATSTFVAPSAAELEQAFDRAYGFAEALEPNDELDIYSRVSNPTRKIACARLATLELGASSDCRAILFPSGLSAIINTIAYVAKPGAVVLCSDPIYGGTYHQLQHYVQEKFGMGVYFFHADDLDQLELLLREYGKKTVMVLGETPANPCLTMLNIQAVVKLTRQYSSALVVIDNTFMTPVLQHPFKHGADLVIHSATKALNGHADAVLGVVYCQTPEQYAGINANLVITGAVASPFESFLLIRSLATLRLRVLAAQENARQVAHCLSRHPAVEKVVYPELFPQQSESWRIYQEQCEGPSSMIALDVAGGKKEAYRVLDALAETHVFGLAVSLGGVRSLVECPWFHTHRDVPDDVKRACGIKPSTIRLSIGLEDPADQCDALTWALDKLN